MTSSLLQLVNQLSYAGEKESLNSYKGYNVKTEASESHCDLVTAARFT